MFRLKNIIQLNFSLRYFLVFAFAFILFTPIGTLSHEGGHWLAATFFGRDTHFGYGYVSFGTGRYDAELNNIEVKYKREISEKSWFEKKDRYEKILNAYWLEERVTRAAGPLQTMLTGTLALIILFRQRKQIRVQDNLNRVQWILVFLCLFWLRQPFNFCEAGIHFLTTGQLPLNGDEVMLARHFKWNNWLLLSLSAFIGFVILVWVLFYLLPLRFRLTFMAAGLVGGLCGAWLWLQTLGPVLMP